MDCNKEEAFRAREIAERKMQNKDFSGARKIAQKAQRLFPVLENISQMLTVCEVHCSANVKVNGEMDWYGILQVEPTADYSSVRKQYRRLALLLHPDKNQFAGAEPAFKLIGEAHMTLSDQEKRHLYDIKRNATFKPALSGQLAPQMRKSSYAATSGFSAVNFNGLNLQQQQPSCFAAAQTFWTICSGCKIRYQYYQSILNKSICCQNFLKPFVAHDLNAEAVPSEENIGQSWIDSGNPQQQIPVEQTNNVHWHNHPESTSSHMGLKVSLSGGLEIKIEHGGGGPANVATDVKMNDKGGESSEVKFGKMNTKETNHGKQAAKPSTANSSQKRARVVAAMDSDGTSVEDIAIEVDGHQAKHLSSFFAPRRSGRLKKNINYNKVGNEDDFNFVSPPHCKMLRGDLLGGADGHETEISHANADRVTSGVDVTNFADDNMENNHKEDARSEEKQPCASKGVKIGDSKQDTVMKEKSGTRTEWNLNSTSNTLPEHGRVTYPDTEFWDFEELRHENAFAVDQIWAVYDNLDGMPRFYARIRHVYAPHFKLRLAWLEHNPLNEVEMAWSDGDLPVGCGNYILGSSQFTEDRLMFSHVVSSEKGKRRNSYTIYPRKGEVWALFKDWKIGWSFDAQNKLYDYEVVEVLSDFAAASGISVIPLVKIEGFVSLFMRAKEKRMAPYEIPPSEILRFSHNIPSYRLTGTEKESIPQGCLELDPASLPTNFSESFPSISFCSNTSRIGNLNEFSGLRFRPTTDEEEPGLSMENDISQSSSPNGVKCVGDAKQYQTTEIHHSDAWRNAQNGTDQSETANIVEDNLDARDINNNAAENENLSSMSSLSPLTYECPEADFHNFDQQKLIGNIQRGQIWAVYSDIDKYPKYYAQIKKVELEEYRVHVAWLEACPVLVEQVRWIEEGMPIACGTFKVERQSMIFDNVDIFSHLVQAKPAGKRNQYVILPSCGEIWAVYKNWNANWKHSDLENCEYDVVEICECTDAGMKVRLLMKVSGYRSIFKPEIEGKAVTMEIPNDKYITFSHKIPAFRLTNEIGGKLQGYWELDTASVPEILLFSDNERCRK
ncbi:unnamed protein product [Musa acuminata subsp. malaccensis]|uniref:(wild Malaysian banana) hypothetical protein n=1 Tax=Musa acuminata subsp. malaccensis TaxID=214687 RepID=A0A804IZB3_MUSAM|nr:PREDICTED: uncharacterized protein LOC103983771 [Musa acuminata subsp. malaccensis]CAG1837094.1 unnamed protein product [Musa acuminata subsp. malaccensis]